MSNTRKNPFAVHVGANVRAKRMEYGERRKATLTQRGLAALVEKFAAGDGRARRLSQGAVSNIENGKHLPTVETLVTIAKALQTTLCSLIQGCDELLADVPANTRAEFERALTTGENDDRAVDRTETDR